MRRAIIVVLAVIISLLTIGVAVAAPGGNGKGHGKPPKPTPSPTATITPTPTPTGTACIKSGDADCGPYYYPKITNSNGFNTYTSSDMWGCGGGSCGPGELFSYDPGNWSFTTTQAAGNTAVLMYPDVQQLTNNWNGTPEFNGNSDVPVNGLTSLTSTYTETMNENPGTIAQASYDIWTSEGEVMIWVDTTESRGTGGADVLDHGTIGDIPFTYLNYRGGLPIIKLDTNQRSGRIDILDGLRWFQSKGILSPNVTIGQLNFGWEICSTGGVEEKFEMTEYSLTIVPR